MKREYVFDVTTEAVVKAVVRIEADDFESAELLLSEEEESGDIEWIYDGVIEGAVVESILRP
jgi:hypothetical protein